jgi:hypothetical protein
MIEQSVDTSVAQRTIIRFLCNENVRPVEILMTSPTICQRSTVVKILGRAEIENFLCS